MSEPSPLSCDHHIPLSQKCDACEPPRRHTCDQHVGCAATHAIGVEPLPHPLDDLRCLIVTEADRLRTLAVAARSPLAYLTAHGVASELADHLEFMAMELRHQGEG